MLRRCMYVAKKTNLQSGRAPCRKKKKTRHSKAGFISFWLKFSPTPFFVEYDRTNWNIIMCTIACVQLVLHSAFFVPRSCHCPASSASHSSRGLLCESALQEWQKTERLLQRTSYISYFAQQPARTSKNGTPTGANIVYITYMHGKNTPLVGT